jgi:hypothetical protein
VNAADLLDAAELNIAPVVTQGPYGRGQRYGYVIQWADGCPDVSGYRYRCPAAAMAAGLRAMEASVIAALIHAIGERGFLVRFVAYCEDTDTPGMLGAGAGVVDRRNSQVKISKVVAARPESSRYHVVEVLRHELHHVADPDWNCGTGYNW